MGVTGLWTVVQPCARPIKIDTLNKKRLAVDASIWVYQFLKAVRDKEGNALRNSHVVGFFRRICKLLFFGIKPVFVFDGGAPALKRQTISGRKARREGRREDAVRTAGKLLAVQMQRRAEQEEQKQREEAERPAQREEEPLPEDMVYVDELQMTEQERNQNRRFKRKDQYHLPDLDMPLSEMGGPNDPRVMSLEELQEYARHFETGEDINVYDFSKIDFNSPFFLSLPATDRYNILNAARLRSRLRMGYSREQLDTMFPDRMAFSRFQIDRVKERNELTQRLMQVGTAEDGTFDVGGTGRVAGEKGKEYVLVKNPGVEGGWALGVIGDKDREEGQRSKPINVDEQEKKAESSDEEVDNADIGLEADDDPDEILRKRQAFFQSRKNRERENPSFKSTIFHQNKKARESLFVAQLNDDADGEESAAAASDDSEEQANLQLAIAMSMQNVGEELTKADRSTEDPTSLDDKGHDYHKPFDESSSDEQMDIDSVLAEARSNKYKSVTSPQKSRRFSAASRPRPSQTCSKEHSGPLPFEKLDLGSPLIGGNKMKQIQEEQAGGFEKGDDRPSRKEKAVPPPPWFSSDVQQGINKQREIEMDDMDQARKADKKRAEGMDYEFHSLSNLQQRKFSADVIDVDQLGTKQDQVIDLDSSDQETGDEGMSGDKATIVEDSDLRMGDVADKVRVEPPEPSQSPEQTQEEHDDEDDVSTSANHKLPLQYPCDNSNNEDRTDQDHDKPYEWEESDREEQQESGPNEILPTTDTTPSGDDQSARSESPGVFVPSEEFLQSIANKKTPTPPPVSNDQLEGPVPMSGTADQEQFPEQSFDDQDMYSDPEDEELMQQLAQEAEEHARFASNLNNKDYRRNIEEYEEELKALRAQQKRDRRDADEVTHIMISECQQLLKLFGLPYVTAPMEAEAQCAELVSLGLVDGIVTDDSDCFLFGGTRVYKNMFNQAKYVECYLTSDLERDYDLTRQKLIRIAHLLGSDYTEGLPGIGPVGALEIVTEFSESLDDFKNWWAYVQTGAPASEEDKKSSWRRKFRKNSTKLFLPPGFPDHRVDYAYMHPEVDSDPSEFQWGVPDLDALRAFLMSTIGWSQERTDEVLVPVIRDMNRRENEGTQANITNFMSGGTGAGAFAPRVRNEGKSRRMEDALERMADRAREKRKTVSKNHAGDPTVDPSDAVVATSGSAVDGTSGTPQKRKRIDTKVNKSADDELNEQLKSDGQESEDEPRKTKQRKKQKSKPKRAKA